VDNKHAADAVLAVDDDPSVLRLLGRVFSEHGIACETVPDPPAAARALAERSYSLILLDVMIPGFSAAGNVRLLRERAPEVPILLMTGGADEAVIDAARAAGAEGPVRKPFDCERLLGTVRSLLGSA